MKNLKLILKKHWQGEMPYSAKYLIVIYLIYQATQKITYFSFANLNWSESLISEIVLSYLVVFNLIITAWCTVGSVRYLTNKASSTSAFLGFILIFGLIIFTLRNYYVIFDNLIFKS